MKNLYQAIHKFQGVVIGARKDAKNPHFKNNYASLESVWATIREPLQVCGLAVVQMPGKLSDAMTLEITTVVAHAESGETLESTIHVPVTKSDAQGVGSAITYGCRYALMAMLGIPPVDDDGEAARMARERRPALPADAPSDLVAWYTANAKRVDAEYVETAIRLWPSVSAVITGLYSDDMGAASEAWFEMDNDDKRAIWLAPSRGGVFSTDERTIIKSTEFREANQVAA
jgi:hypothetical protein